MDLSERADHLLSTTDARNMAADVSSDSEAEAPQRQVPGRTRGLEQTVERRLRQALKLYALSQSPVECAENLTFLKEVSVGRDVGKAYKMEAQAFFVYATEEKLRLVEADEIDRGIVAYMNRLDFQGHQAWRGQKLLAALNFLDGTLGRNGARKIPRSWRSLKE